MKINEEVLITGGFYQGRLAYYVDELEDSRPSVSNVQLQANMMEIQVFTKDLEPVESEGELGMEAGDKVRFTSGAFAGHSGRLAEVRSHTADVILDADKDRTINESKTALTVISKTPKRHNEDYLYVLDLGARTVQVHLNDMARENEAYVSLSNGGFVIKGKDNLEEFIRAVAIAGDLIKEDEELVVAPKIDFEVPEDGLYSLDMDNASRPVIVKDGKCLGAEGNYALVDITEWIEMKVELGEGKLVPFDMKNLL